jgi:type IV secretory pathway TraG/TraD family ATPase VirD4
MNPFDRRAAPWSPLSEMQFESDAHWLANAIIPEPPSASDRSWYGYARQILAAVLIYVWKNNGTNGELVDILTLAQRDKDLIAACYGTPASVLFLQGNEKMRGNAQGVLSPYLNALMYLPRESGSRGFALRKWVDKRYKRMTNGWLWWPIPTNQIDALAPLIAAQIAALITAILQLPANHSARIFLVADEFAQLGKVSSIERALTLGRKHGLAAILAIQSVAQLRQVYGKDGAQVLLSCLSSWIILRSADSETSEAMSKHIGDHEIEVAEKSEGESGGYGDGRSQRSHSTTTSRRRRIERAYLPSEIQRLSARQAIVTLADRPEVVSVTVPLVTPHIPQVARGFAPRPNNEPPQADSRTPTPASPVPGGGSKRSPAPKTSPAKSTSSTVAATPSSPPVRHSIALDELVSHDQPSLQTHHAQLPQCNDNKSTDYGSDDSTKP